MEFWVNLAVSLGGTLVVAGIAWGSMSSKLKHLELTLERIDKLVSGHDTSVTTITQQQSACNQSCRKDVAELVRSIERLEARKLEEVQSLAEIKARMEMHKADIADLKQSKASIEMVDGLRETIGRIDAKLDALLRRNNTSSPM